MTTPSWDPTELERVACDLCQQNKAKPLFVRSDGMQVVECAECGLAYLNPRPRSEFIQRLYGRDYFLKTTGDSPIGYAGYFTDGYRQVVVAEAESRLRLLAPFCQFRGAHTLEVGCATGEFSALIKRNGAAPMGLDLSEPAILQARKAYPGVDFKVGAIEDVPPTASFDAAFAFELIEHVTSPSRFFRCVHSLLKPGGLLVLSTPNLECGRRVGFEKWIGFNSSFEHLYFFSRETLQKFASSCGFQEVQWLTGGGDGLPLPVLRPSPKDRLVSALRSLGLLDVARSVKGRFARNTPQPTHVPGGDKHNLVHVFRKERAGRA